MGMIMDILSGVGNTLDVPGAIVRNTLGGRNPLEPLLSPWSSTNRYSGRDLLRKWGMADDEDTWGNLAGGIGLELATDPLNMLAGAGLLKRAFQGAKIAKATQAVDAANEASQVMRRAGYMPEEVARLTKLKQKQDLWGGIPSIENEFAHLPEFQERIARRPPLRVYHETAAPYFGSHEFMPDPGTNNWLGKGTYFTTQPGEAAGAYSKWDKSGSIMPSEPGSFVRTAEPRAIIDAFRKHMPEAYFKNITPQLERDILPEVGAVALQHPDQYPKKLVEALQPHYRQINPDPFDLSDVSEEAVKTSKSQSAPRTMMAFVDSRNPYRFEEPATISDIKDALKTQREWGPQYRTFRDTLRQATEKGKLSKGDVWALLQSQGKSPDEITDILRDAGYDAIMHEPGTGTRIQERMYKLGRKAPDIDEHSELVAFSPSQIYQPFIAPALKARPDQLKKIPKSLKSALGIYEGGASTSRGRGRQEARE